MGYSRFIQRQRLVPIQSALATSTRMLLARARKPIQVATSNPLMRLFWRQAQPKKKKQAEIVIDETSRTQGLNWECPGKPGQHQLISFYGGRTRPDGGL